MIRNYVNMIESTHNDLVHQYSRKIPNDSTAQNYLVANIYSDKNRFYNILPSEETRVKLADVGYYINANHILDSYIATQQPLPNTFNDFWAMVYEKNAALIINLSGFNDYLPMECGRVYGEYYVRVEDITDRNLIKIRNIHITKNNETKVIYHATFSLWPDFGIPSEEDFLKLFDAISMIDYMSHKGPIIVHCRAGVGRTGTFILVHYILKKVNEGVFCSPVDVLHEMRRGRSGMVQEACQFEFALRVICRKLDDKQDLLQVPKRKLSASCDL